VLAAAALAGAASFGASFGESFGESANAIPVVRNSDNVSDASFLIASLFFGANFDLEPGKKAQHPVSERY
jgi:hypothetical protein